jgi:hypothetical protein
MGTNGTKVGTTEGIARNAEIRDLFENLDPCRRAHYVAMAVTRNDSRKRVLEQAEPGAGLPSDDLGSIYAQKRARTLAFKSKVNEIKNHPIWKAGVGIDTVSLGLLPIHVDMTSTREQIADEVATIFKYDPELVKNPLGAMHPCIPCCVKFGGMCCT